MDAFLYSHTLFVGTVIVRFDAQLSKAKIPKLIIGDCNLRTITLSNEEQFLKADEPIDDTVLGIVIDSNSSQPKNALLLILLT